MNTHTIKVRDQDGDIELAYADLLKYTTNANVIASALMIRVCKFAFEKLSPNTPVLRRQLYWRLGFPGPGLVDCVEMISHAVREGRCLQQPEHHHPHAPFSLNGQFVFEISYDGKTIVVWPDKSIFDDEFRMQVKTWQEEPCSTERQAFITYKMQKVTQLLSLEDEHLFHFEWK